MPINRIILIGAGGHACVVYDAARLAFPDVEIIVVDDNPDLAGAAFCNIRVSGPPPASYQTDEFVHVAIGKNSVRAAVLARVRAVGARTLTIRHPHATVSVHAIVEDACFLAAGCVIAPQAHLGTGVIVNHHAVVDHDCKIGAYSHIAPGAVLGGQVRTGFRALIGAGAIVLPGKTVGADAILGAGAVLTRTLENGQLATGVPARLRLAAAPRGTPAR